MTPGQAAELREGQCLLCGLEAETYLDLCDSCADVVQAVADRVAGRVLREVVPGVLQVPGQLELGVEP